MAHRVCAPLCSHRVFAEITTNTGKFNPTLMAELVWDAVLGLTPTGVTPEAHTHTVRRPPDVLIVTNPDTNDCDDTCTWDASQRAYVDCAEGGDPLYACAISGAILHAVALGIPVISVNAGQGLFNKLGVWHHVGQEEYLAGKLACRRLIENGATHILISDGEAGGHEAINQRVNGCKAEIETHDANVKYSVFYDFREEVQQSQTFLEQLFATGSHIEEASADSSYTTIDAALGTNGKHKNWPCRATPPSPPRASLTIHRAGYTMLPFTNIAKLTTNNLTNNLASFDVTQEVKTCLEEGMCNTIHSPPANKRAGRMNARASRASWTHFPPLLLMCPLLFTAHEAFVITCA